MDGLQPVIKVISEKKLIGLYRQVSLADMQTKELWTQFMSQVHTIPMRANEKLFSVEIFNETYFKNFDPGNKFLKWAAVEVTELVDPPAGMHSLIVPAGTYAVFVHKGFNATHEYIFKIWLPTSGYDLDNRPHFAEMGNKYKNNSADSEEELYIPVKLKPDRG